MSRKRRQHGSEFKAQVAMAAVKEQQTVQELAKRFVIHTSQIQEWKRRLVERAAEIFQSPRRKQRRPMSRVWRNCTRRSAA
jgi:transposase